MSAQGVRDDMTEFVNIYSWLSNPYHEIRDKFKAKTFFLENTFFRDEFLSINERPDLPLRKYGMPIYKHLFFNRFCVIYFWVCFIFPRWLERKLM